MKWNAETKPAILICKKFNRRTMRKNSVFVIMLCAVVLGVLGCATVPKEIDFKNPAQILPPDDAVYLFIDVAQSTGLLSAVLDGFQTREQTELLHDFISRTDHLYLSLNKPDDPEPGISLVAVGNYPRGAVGWWASWSRDWKRQRKPWLYWQSNAGNLNLSVPTRSIIVLTNGSMETLFNRISPSQSTKFSSLIEQLDSDFEGLAALYDTAFLIETLLSGFDLPSKIGSVPINTAVASFRSEPGGYIFTIDLDFISERDARIYSVIIKLIVAASKKRIDSTLENMPLPSVTLESASIRVKDVYVSEANMNALLKSALPFSEDREGEIQ